MPKRWRIATYDPARVAALERAAGIPPSSPNCCWAAAFAMPMARGSFSMPSSAACATPKNCPAMCKPPQLIHGAIRDSRRITVYGDYDADGMTATAILLLCLRLLGARADFYIPNRIDEGYGLNHEALRTLAAGGADVVVTVDCGIASVAEAETARAAWADAHRRRSSSAGTTQLAQRARRSFTPACPVPRIRSPDCAAPASR